MSHESTHNHARPDLGDPVDEAGHPHSPEVADVAPILFPGAEQAEVDSPEPVHGEHPGRQGRPRGLELDALIAINDGNFLSTSSRWNRRLPRGRRVAGVTFLLLGGVALAAGSVALESHALGWLLPTAAAQPPGWTVQNTVEPPTELVPLPLPLIETAPVRARVAPAAAPAPRPVAAAARALEPTATEPSPPPPVTPAVEEEQRETVAPDTAQAVGLPDPVRPPEREQEAPVRDWTAGLFDPPPAPAPPPGPVELTRAQVVDELRPLTQRVRYCTPEHIEEVVVQLVVEGATGRITRSSVTGELADSTASRCIERVLGSAQFPQFSQSHQRIRNYIFALR